MYSRAYRIPALVDHTAGDVSIFESGAIMWWLASRDPEARLFPKDAAKQAEVMSWLMFQMVGTPSPSDCRHQVVSVCNISVQDVTSNILGDILCRVGSAQCKGKQTTS